MSRSNPLSSEQDVLVDANIFFAIGHPSNPKYARFRSAIRNAGVVCKLPQRVIGELGGSEMDRVRTALDEGWAEIIDAPSPADGDAVAASDIATRTIANETGKPEHEVEKNGCDSRRTASSSTLGIARQSVWSYSPMISQLEKGSKTRSLHRAILM